MSRDLITFPLSQSAKFKMSNSGFINTDDLKGFKPSELAKETGLSTEEALQVLQIVFPEPDNKKKSEILSCSAYDILAEEKGSSPISTSCEALNNILGGGITLSKVTEICGCPGSGKTQLCTVGSIIRCFVGRNHGGKLACLGGKNRKVCLISLQLCTNVTIPEHFGGLDGEALFIDTEGSFVIQRLAQIAAATVKNCKGKHKDNTAFREYNVEKVLKSIYYYPCKSYTEVIARINLLQEFLEKHKKVRLIIIDSITFHFRYGFDGSYALRTRLLNGIMQILVKVAHDYKVAVVLTNQMTTKFDFDGTSHLVPALGESWGHACTVRLVLAWTEFKRQAHLLKSPSMPEMSTLYMISADGVRDIM